jgi:site-specific recombinase XerD
MEVKTLDTNKIKAFAQHLQSEERSKATLEKYIRDVHVFAMYAAGAEIDKEIVVKYKNELKNRYAATSANSMLAALNAFFRFCGWHELCVRQFRIQREAYCTEQKELTKREYARLLSTANAKGKERLNLIIQTICGTGIRVSELKYITVEAIKRGEATVDCKGKLRRIFLVPELCRRLRRYTKEHGIAQGSVFVSRSGKPINRSQIWREMKELCEDAGVLPSKVFPHNLRHLFARTFYGIEKDIAKLADILGHASINTTRIYITTTSAEHKRQMASMRLIL